MRVLIVEDETSSYKNLLSILKEVEPEIEVAGNTESVAETVRWLSTTMLQIPNEAGSSFDLPSKIELRKAEVLS